VTPGKHSTELFVDASIRFFENRESDDPFFMYLSLMAPHDPRTMPEKFLKMYDPEKIDLPENFSEEHAIDTGALQIRDELLAEHPRNPDEIKRHIAEYYGMISHLDDEIGRLIKVLDSVGELENTIVVFAGDNGLAVGQHGLMGKQNLYEHSVRVPLIFSGPGIPRGERRNSLAYLLDIFPTVCELSGIDIPESVEGKSLLQCIKDSDTQVRDYMYLAYAESIRGSSDGKHKLIEYACGETQLFDLVSDPLERNSLTRLDSCKADISRMRKKLVEMAQDWDDEQHPKGKEFWEQRDDLKTVALS